MIYAYCGKLGHGKSYRQLWHVLRLADADKKDIVTNLPDINLQALHKYCVAHNLHWVAARIRRGYWFVETEVNRILAYENAVVMVDEMGIFKNARDRNWDASKRFFADLFLSRKAGQDICWVAQDYEMVDLNIRRVTNFYYHCINTHPKAQKHVPWRRLTVTTFDAAGYEKWVAEKTMATMWKHKLKLPEVVPFEQDLMACYNTKNRLDGSVVYSLPELAAQVGGLDGEAIAPKLWRPCVLPAELKLERDRAHLVEAEDNGVDLADVDEQVPEWGPGKRKATEPRRQGIRGKVVSFLDKFDSLVK